MAGLDLRQTQKLTQQLVMSQQLQQAIKLLQLNQMELVEHIQAELMENPTLEEIPGTRDVAVSDGEQRLQDTATAQQTDQTEQSNGAEEGAVDWGKVLDDYSASAFKSGTGGGDYDELPPIEATLSGTTSLVAHLCEQLGLLECEPDEHRAAAAVILNLDERGWLDCDLEEIVAEAEVSMEAADRGLQLVMAMDPPGCGARNLRECLSAQAEIRWPEDPTVGRILREHLNDLETRNYAGISRALGLELEDVVEYHKMIKELEPWPGREFAEMPSQYITPDITLMKVGGEWQILLNEDGMPRLRVSPYYRGVLQGGGSTKEEKDYIRERLDSADFLIKSIYKRQQTIYKVMKSILDRQHDFFDKGPELLKPMILRDVADEIGAHESTVSRVTTNKYVQCPHGIFELKYFFNAGITRLNGEDLAGEAVKQMIRKLVSDENTSTPLSDQDIVDLLRKKNIKIARRTVAKYREAMGILPSTQRKQLF